MNFNLIIFANIILSASFDAQDMPIVHLLTPILDIESIKKLEQWDKSDFDDLKICLFSYRHSLALYSKIHLQFFVKCYKNISYNYRTFHQELEYRIYIRKIANSINRDSHIIIDNFLMDKSLGLLSYLEFRTTFHKKLTDYINSDKFSDELVKNHLDSRISLYKLHFFILNKIFCAGYQIITNHLLIMALIAKNMVEDDDRLDNKMTLFDVLLDKQKNNSLENLCQEIQKICGESNTKTDLAHCKKAFLLDFTKNTVQICFLINRLRNKKISESTNKKKINKEVDHIFNELLTSKFMAFANSHFSQNIESVEIHCEIFFIQKFFCFFYENDAQSYKFIVKLLKKIKYQIDIIPKVLSQNVYGIHKSKVWFDYSFLEIISFDLFSKWDRIKIFIDELKSIKTVGTNYLDFKECFECILGNRVLLEELLSDTFQRGNLVDYLMLDFNYFNLEFDEQIKNLDEKILSKIKELSNKEKYLLIEVYDIMQNILYFQINLDLEYQIVNTDKKDDDSFNSSINNCIGIVTSFNNMRKYKANISLFEKFIDKTLEDLTRQKNNCDASSQKTIRVKQVPQLHVSSAQQRPVTPLYHTSETQFHAITDEPILRRKKIEKSHKKHETKKEMILREALENKQKKAQQ